MTVSTTGSIPAIITLARCIDAYDSDKDFLLIDSAKETDLIPRKTPHGRITTAETSLREELQGVTFFCAATLCCDQILISYDCSNIHTEQYVVFTAFGSKRTIAIIAKFFQY